MRFIFHVFLAFTTAHGTIEVAPISSSTTYSISCITNLLDPNGSIDNMAHSGLGNSKTAAILTESKVQDEVAMMPLIRRLREYEKRAVKNNLIDADLIQPRKIGSWSDLVERAERLVYGLGDTSKVLSDRAYTIKLNTFLQKHSDWEKTVEEFLNDDTYLDEQLKGSAKNKAGTKRRNLKGLGNSDTTAKLEGFLQVDETSDHTPNRKENTKRPASKTKNKDSNSKSEETNSKVSHKTRKSRQSSSARKDAALLSDSLELQSQIDSRISDNTELEKALADAGLRNTKSLIDDEADSDSRYIAELNTELESSDGPLGIPVSADPAKDTVLTSILNAMNSGEEVDSADTPTD